MEYLIGVALAGVVCAFAMLAGFDRDRVFYPTLLAVIATYYILFAVMGKSTPALTIESVVAGYISDGGGGGIQEEPLFPSHQKQESETGKPNAPPRVERSWCQ